MNVNIAGSPEEVIFEVMELEIGDRVRHVRLAGDERLLPDDPAVAEDAAFARQVARQRSGAKLWPDRAGSELRMGKIEVVLLLHDVIGIFIAERKAQPHRRAVARDHVDSGDLRLFAAVSAKSGNTRSPPGAAIIEPSPL